MEVLADKSFETITQKCMNFYRSSVEMGPCELANSIMQSEDVPMHHFAHHYLVPAVLMTIVCRKQGYRFKDYSANMSEAEKRAKNVLPAFCGFYGACGAAIGVGIFMSIYTGTTPLTKETWKLCNMSTADALKEMAKIGGPRCCKRNTFVALQESSNFISKDLHVDILKDERIECRFSHFNLECLREDCPFYSEKLDAWKS